MHLVVASARPLHSAHDPRLYWAGLARGGFHRHDIPARDSGLILKSPHVEKLTEWVREALRTARKKAARGIAQPIATLTQRAFSWTMMSFMLLF